MLKNKRIVIALLVFAFVLGQLSSSLAVDVEEPTGCTTQVGYSTNADGARIGLQCWWTTSNLTFGFDENVTDQMKNKIRAAINTWESVELSVGAPTGEYFNIEEEQGLYYPEDVSIMFKYVNIDQMRGDTYARSNGPIATTWIYIDGEHVDVTTASGVIDRVEIRICNAYEDEYSFSNTPTADMYNFESIVLHEIGHALGVAHCHEISECRNYCDNNVMAPTLDKGVVKRTLAAYDTASLQVIYCMNHPLP